MESSEILLNNKYQLLSKLGTGATAEVLLGENKETHERVAIKILKDNLLIKIFEQEVQMLKQIQSPYIINILDGGSGPIVKDGVCSDVRAYLILELAEKGELFDYVFYPGIGFGENYGRFLFTRIIEGIDACHNANIVHRDIKMENIMIDSQWNVKISDFGFATLIKGKKGNGILTTPLGTISYAAPEILRKQPYHGIPADIFSMGALLFTIVTGRMGFSKAVKVDPFYKNIYKKDYHQYWKIISTNNKMKFSDEFKDLYTKLIAFEPKERPTLKEIRDHPWMTLSMPSFDEMKSEFENRDKAVHKVPEIVIDQQETEEKQNQVYRSFSNQFFDKRVRCSKYNEKSLTHFKIAIKGIVPHVYMNQIACYLEAQSNKNRVLTPNQDNCSLTINYEEDQVEDCEIEVERFELNLTLERVDSFNNFYVLILEKTAGDKMQLYELYNELLTYTQTI